MSFPPYPPSASNPNLSAQEPKVTAWNDGDADGTWAAAGNWDNGIPANSDTAILATSSRDIAAANQSAVTLDELLIHDAYTGGLGGNAGLKINAARVIIRKSAGTVYLWGWFGDVYIMNTAGGSSAVRLRAPSPAKLGNVHVLSSRGIVTIIGSSVMDYCYVSPGGGTAQVELGSSITKYPDATAATNFPRLIRGGRGADISTATGADENVASGCRFEWTDGGADNVTVMTGARANWKSDDQLDGVVTCWSGTFTLADNPNTGVIIDDIEAYRGSTVDLRCDVNDVSITNDIKLYGGTFYPPAKTTETVDA
jgi:hypothetical protein